MPPARTLRFRQFEFSRPAKPGQKINECDQVTTTCAAVQSAHAFDVVVAKCDEIVDLARCNVTYPLDSAARRVYKTKDGKKPTAHQWAVYDFVRNIPAGKVTTYKDICLALGQGSPRSVGAALRKNPFAPFVPCHRIIASTHYIGGFFGEWGPNLVTGGMHCRRKIDMLAKEGVGFTDKGYLIGGDATIWKG